MYTLFDWSPLQQQMPHHLSYIAARTLALVLMLRNPNQGCTETEWYQTRTYIPHPRLTSILHHAASHLPIINLNFPAYTSFNWLMQHQVRHVTWYWHVIGAFNTKCTSCDLILACHWQVHSQGIETNSLVNKLALKQNQFWFRHKLACLQRGHSLCRHQHLNALSLRYRVIIMSQITQL